METDRLAEALRDRYGRNAARFNGWHTPVIPGFARDAPSVNAALAGFCGELT
jgi:hypothetical protein